MKKFVLAALIFLTSLTTYAQQKRTTYLTVWFEKKYDHYKQYDYCVMTGEAGNYAVPEVFKLVPYRSVRDLQNKNIDFYHNLNDSVQLYNYFLNSAAALEYLSKHGWQLVTIANEVASGAKDVWHNGRYVLMPSVSSVQKYYLRKEID